MSWRDNLADAQARLAALEQAELDFLSGKRVTAVTSGPDKIEYEGRGGATVDDIRKAIFETNMVIRRLSGNCRGNAFVPIFGR